MGYGYFDYSSVSKKKENVQRALEKLRQHNPKISPVVIEGARIAKTWWGTAWNRNLESYADYSNRIGRGSVYVKNGMVLDLQIGKGEVNALVHGFGDEPYKVKVTIDRLSDEKWNKVKTICSHKIESAAELAKGRLPKEMTALFMQRDGLFPTPREIRMNCSCPDWADMCKHVAAVLYGVGARLDNDPLLFFTLRDIDFSVLLKKSVEEKIDNMLKNADRYSSRIIIDTDINELFGINQIIDNEPAKALPVNTDAEISTENAENTENTENTVEPAIEADTNEPEQVVATDIEVAEREQEKPIKAAQKIKREAKNAGKVKSAKAEASIVAQPPKSAEDLSEADYIVLLAELYVKAQMDDEVSKDKLRAINELLLS
ncbi:MAG: SWIM zinc finger family protein [Oscillospiraceae bacterium]|nr:SWIM zinc finger family protein [Oscillospiraceae bacterium]